ncbi:MAG TPA: OmpA family protein [Chitinophagales bacterium]|nr:OmpA family protein [Chitinophagales bacterium]
MNSKIFTLLFLFISSRQLLAQDHSLIVYFDFNASELPVNERMRLLYFLDDSLDKARSYTIQIKGYCDFIDNDSYNNTLSQERADYVKNILLSNGIKESAIALCKGYGEKTADNRKDSETERQLQRRVEINFICNCHEQTTFLNDDDEKKEITLEDDKEEYFVDGDIDITKYDVGDKFALESLHFIGGRHKLLPESVPSLKNLLKVMKENPTLHILIIGHICCEADIAIDGYDYDTHTYNLSYNRAKEIYEYLVRNGIDATRMDFKGMGGKEKIYPHEMTEEQRTANRRVEIEVVEM